MRSIVVVTLSLAFSVLVGRGGSGSSAPPRAKIERNPIAIIEQSTPLLQTESGAMFRFTSPSPDVTFRVVLDGKFLNDMKSSIALTDLAEGSHRLSVRAIHAGGEPSENGTVFT